jgi:hypothetical protein
MAKFQVSAFSFQSLNQNIKVVVFPSTFWIQFFKVVVFPSNFLNITIIWQFFRVILNFAQERYYLENKVGVVHFTKARGMVKFQSPRALAGPWALKHYHSLGVCKIYYPDFIFKVMYHCFCFHYWDYLTNIWRNNWQSILDGVEGDSILQKIWHFSTFSNPKLILNFYITATPELSSFNLYFSIKIFFFILASIMVF